LILILIVNQISGDFNEFKYYANKNQNCQKPHSSLAVDRKHDDGSSWNNRSAAFSSGLTATSRPNRLSDRTVTLLILKANQYESQ